nr:MAG TPA: hypothetical protein [Caudoviricetes sp.]
MLALYRKISLISPFKVLGVALLVILPIRPKI